MLTTIESVIEHVTAKDDILLYCKGLKCIGVMVPCSTLCGK